MPTSNRTPYNRTSAAASIVKALVAQTDRVLAERGQPGLPEGVTAHASRKTYFTFMHEEGAPPRWVADQGGHSDPSTSLRICTESLRGRQRRQHGQGFDDLVNGDGTDDADVR